MFKVRISRESKGQQTVSFDQMGGSEMDEKEIDSISHLEHGPCDTSLRELNSFVVSLVFDAATVNISVGNN